MTSNTLDHVNPVQYAALYFGHKLHIDQNEKLKMYGVTHVVARDGFSGKIAYSSTAIQGSACVVWGSRVAIAEYFSGKKHSSTGVAG